MKKIILFIVTFSLFISCNEEEIEFSSNPFIVAFSVTSDKILLVNEKQVDLLYSESAKESGRIVIDIKAKNAVYGVDFTTVPEAKNNKISLLISPNETKNSFKIIELNDSFTSNMEIDFSITNIDISNSSIQGNSKYLLSDNAFLGGTFSPTIGGPNEPNQVYVDLSSNKETLVKRSNWDLGFYSGDDFRVVLNGSIYMATGSLGTTDMNSITSANVEDFKKKVRVRTFDPLNAAFIDNPDGDIAKTAINEIMDDNTQNPVYLLNLGVEVGTADPEVGSVAVSGSHRGWKKIRILKDGDNYKLQYADLDDTTFKEEIISKNETYNFSFFSFDKEEIVTVEPPKINWDICFTVFTNVIKGAGSYGYSDFVIHNRKGGALSYLLENSTITFNEFTKKDIDESLFLENQTVIGSSWRDLLTNFIVFPNNFYILKDSEGNYYKIKFLNYFDAKGVRGHTKFEFELLK